MISLPIPFDGWADLSPKFDVKLSVCSLGLDALGEKFAQARG
jgi:hypothetical protein